MRTPDRYTCEELFRRLDAYLDRTLGPEELRRVEEHLAECASCAAEYRFETRLLEGVREKLRQAALPPGVLDRITASLAQAAAPRETILVVHGSSAASRGSDPREPD